MACPPVAPVRCLGEYAVELSHPLRQIAIRRFDYQVIMVEHQAIGMTDAIKIFNYLPEGIEKAFPVSVVFID